MNIFNRISNFFNGISETKTVVNGISDNKSTSIVNGYWQVDYGMSVVTKIFCAAISNVKWKTYKDGEEKQGKDWLRFNYSPNKKQTAVEFYNKLGEKLINDRKVLIIELSSQELFVADSFQFKNGTENTIKENIFINVTVEDVSLNRSFKENKDCMYIKLPELNNVNSNIQSMTYEFNELKNLINKGAKKALGTKYNLQTNATGKNSTDKEYVGKLQEIYMPLMEKADAVFLTTKGEELKDLTEKQRGSEVEQVLQAVANNIVIDNEILYKVGAAHGIPRAFMLGDYTQKNEDIWRLLMTLFIKPHLKLLSEKFTVFAITEESIIKGSKIVAELDTIEFMNALSQANAIDKLISSGAFLTDEVREKLGHGPIENGDVRLITKNYAPAETVLEGGGNDGKE